MIAETLAITGFSVSMPVIPLYLAEDIGIADPQRLKVWTGAIQSAAAVTLAVFAPVWGRLADLYSRRAMLLRAMFGGAVVVSLMSLVTAPWQLLILRAVQGCLTGTVSAATVLMSGIVPQESLALSLGLLQTCVAVGNSAGPLLGGVVSDFLGRRLAFLGTGILLLSAGLMVLRFVHDAPKSGDERLEGNFFKQLIPDITPVRSSPVLISLLLTAFSLQVANSTANPILPLFLRELAHDSRFLGSATGIVLGAGAAATALAALLSGKFAYKTGYRKSLRIYLAAGCVSIIPQAFSQNIYQLTVIHIIASFWLGGAAPVMQAMIAENTAQAHRGSVFGWTTSISMLGAALGPLIGSAAAMISYRAVFPVTAFILGAASARLFMRRAS